MKNINLPYTLETIFELSSDHHPVLLTIGDGQDDENKIEIKETNW